MPYFGVQQNPRAEDTNRIDYVSPSIACASHWLAASSP